MNKKYIYEKPKCINITTTKSLTAAFAGGGWLHINKEVNKPK